jgi:hypothetical protein
MIYQEMIGYLTIEDPREQEKVWQSLSPQVRDYLNIFLDLMSQSQENVYYEKSKFYRLITADEFENLRQVYLKMQSKDIVIDSVFEEEFKLAFISYEKKAEMKAKMNQWRVEMENGISTTPVPSHEPVLNNKQQNLMENKMHTPRLQTTKNEKQNSTGGCLIAIFAGILILIVLYWVLK